MIRRYRKRMAILKLLFFIFIVFMVCLWISMFSEDAMNNNHRNSENTIQLDKVKLSKLIKQFPTHMNTGFKKYQVNVTLSNLMPLDRKIPDTRPSACHTIYGKFHELPEISIVIPFHNEVWSMLLRTLHSIYSRTSSKLLHEIILVDDASTYEFLKEPMEDYINALPKIKLFRNDVREGLIRSRIKGAQFSTGKVLVFLDAHVEVGYGWLEPLLVSLSQNKTTIAVPHIDLIKPKSLKYKAWTEKLHGGFSWTMDYVWKVVPKRYLTASETDLIPTPTTIGCAMAMYRNYFFTMGAFDEGMNIWGGENLELSFRTWMCGGSLHIVPCSRVGHVFRAYLPYEFPQELGGGNIILKNYQRIVDVWLDEFKTYYYTTAKKIVPYGDNDLQTLQTRKQLRKCLNCKSFKWYLKNVIPEMLTPKQNALLFGQMKNLGGNLCVSSQAIIGGKILPLTDCKLHERYQGFSFTNTSQLVDSNDKCLTVSSTDILVTKSCYNKNIGKAISKQLWSFIIETGQFVRKNIIDNHDLSKPIGRLQIRSGQGQYLCLTQISFQGEQVLWVEECKENNEFQHWIFTYQHHANRFQTNL